MSVFANTGQDCCARSRVFVERAIFEKFVERFAASTGNLSVGEPTRTNANRSAGFAAQRETPSNLSMPRKGGRTIHRRRAVLPGLFPCPAVVLGASRTTVLARGDFRAGGCHPALRRRSRDVARSERLALRPERLGLDERLQRALRVVRRVESGVLSVNSHSSVHVEAPFGGFKQSGIGRDLGMNALEGYTELKNVYVAD